MNKEQLRTLWDAAMKINQPDLPRSQVNCIKDIVRDVIQSHNMKNNFLFPQVSSEADPQRTTIRSSSTERLSPNTTGEGG